MSITYSLTNSLKELKKTAKEFRDGLAGLARNRSPEEIAAKALQAKQNVKACQMALQDLVIEEMKARDKEKEAELKEVEKILHIELEKIKFLQLESTTRSALEKRLLNKSLEELVGRQIVIQNAENVARGLLLEEVNGQSGKLRELASMLLNTHAIYQEEERDRNVLPDQKIIDELAIIQTLHPYMIKLLIQSANASSVFNQGSVIEQNSTTKEHSIEEIRIAHLIEACKTMKEQHLPFLAHYFNVTQPEVEQRINKILEALQAKITEYKAIRKQDSTWTIRKAKDKLSFQKRESLSKLSKMITEILYPKKARISDAIDFCNTDSDSENDPRNKGIRASLL